MSEWIDVAAAEAVTEDEPYAASAAGKPLALFRLGEQVFALHDLCSHGQARLSDGFMDGDAVECPLHQGLVCIRDGEPQSAPITEPVDAFPARVNGGRIEVFI